MAIKLEPEDPFSTTPGLQSIIIRRFSVCAPVCAVLLCVCARTVRTISRDLLALIDTHASYGRRNEEAAKCNNESRS
jgi:hypothetical protein